MCRSFLDTPVPPAKLDKALALAACAPSAGNTAGFAFVVLEGARTTAFWQHAADKSWLERPDHPGLLRAPVIVLPLAGRAAYLARYAEPDKSHVSGPAGWTVPYWVVDTAFATMLLLLGLAEEGLGALFFSLRVPPGPLLRELGVPEGWEPIGAVAVGWPSEEATARRPKARKRFGEVVHRGRWQS